MHKRWRSYPRSELVWGIEWQGRGHSRTSRGSRRRLNSVRDPCNAVPQRWERRLPWECLERKLELRDPDGDATPLFRWQPKHTHALASQQGQPAGRRACESGWLAQWQPEKRVRWFRSQTRVTRNVEPRTVVRCIQWVYTTGASAAPDSSTLSSQTQQTRHHAHGTYTQHILDGKRGCEAGSEGKTDTGTPVTLR